MAYAGWKWGIIGGGGGGVVYACLGGWGYSYAGRQGRQIAESEGMENGALAQRRGCPGTGIDAGAAAGGRLARIADPNPPVPPSPHPLLRTSRMPRSEYSEMPPEKDSNMKRAVGG